MKASASRLLCRTTKARVMRNDFSVGGVVTDSNGRVALIRTTNLNGDLVWGLPKGHPKAVSSDLGRLSGKSRRKPAASRGQTSPRQARIDYWFVAKDGQRVHKRVDFYAMQAVGGSPDDHDDEVEEVALLIRSAARARPSPTTTSRGCSTTPSPDAGPGRVAQPGRHSQGVVPGRSPAMEPLSNRRPPAAQTGSRRAFSPKPPTSSWLSERARSSRPRSSAEPRPPGGPPDSTRTPLCLCFARHSTEPKLRPTRSTRDRHLAQGGGHRRRRLW